MIKKEEYDKINKILDDEIIHSYLTLWAVDNVFEIYYKIKIAGTKKMISVGEYYDYTQVDVLLVGANDALIKFIKTVFYEKLGNKVDLERILKSSILSYISLRTIVDEISNVLGYFSSDPNNRITINDFKISPKLIEEIEKYGLGPL